MISRRMGRENAPGIQYWSDYQYRAVDFGFDGDASGGKSHEHTQLFGADMNFDGGRGIAGAFGGLIWADLALSQIDQKASIFGPQLGLYGHWSDGPSHFYGRASL